MRWTKPRVGTSWPETWDARRNDDDLWLIERHRDDYVLFSVPDMDGGYDYKQRYFVASSLEEAKMWAEFGTAD